MNTVNARYGNDPGIKAYIHINDRFAPFASQPIPATVSEASYLLNGLTMNEVGRRIEGQYADTGGFTDHLVGISAILGYRLCCASAICRPSGCTCSISPPHRPSYDRWLAARHARR